MNLSSILKSLAGLLALAVLIWGVSWGYSNARARVAKHRAKAALAKALPAVAADEVDQARHQLAKTGDGCLVLINSYFQAKKADRLGWTAQKCKENDVDIPEIYLAQAAALEFQGRDPEALTLFLQVASKFPSNPDIPYRLAYIFRRAGNVDAAVGSFLKAAQMAPKSLNLQVEVLEYLGSLGRWKDSRPVSDRLRGIETDNPAVKLLLARSLKNTGDEPGAETYISHARSILQGQPQLRAQLEKLYPELLQKRVAKE